MAADERNETRHHSVRLGADEETPTGPRAVRALMISAAGGLGGAERSFFELIKNMPRNVVVPEVCVPPESPLARLCSLAGVEIHPVAFRRFHRTCNPFVLAGQLRAIHRGALSLGSICRARKFDVLHANTDSAALVAWEASRSLKLPFVWHCRDMRPMHGFARILGGAAAAVVAISGAVERHLLKEGVPAAKLKHIDNGIDLTAFYPLQERAAVRARVRGQLGIPYHSLVVLSVGAYVPWKRHELFLQALAQLRRRLPDVVGLLVGSDLMTENGTYRHSLVNLADELALKPPSLQVLHERTDVPELMAAADLLVSCSDHEPFGRVLAEAGAAGVPVVTTDSGAKAEVVADGVTGALTPRGDAGALAAACLELLLDQPRRAQMGVAARQRVEQCFDIRRTAGQLAALLDSVAGARRV